MTSSPAYITDRQSLRNFVERVRHHNRIALDTEFVGEDSFVPRLELIQVAAGDLSAAIDFPAVGSLDDFGPLLADPAIEKVVHAGRQDLELFYAHTGIVPTPIFDTQVAAAMVGYGTQIAYAQLVQRIVGVKLTKAHTFTNWSQRPLTKEQVVYALDDVHYLLPVHTHLQERLKALGRKVWVEEEFIRLGSKLTDGSREPRHRYQRIRGWENLKPRCAAVLRELVAWREEEAKRRDVPRGRVIRDEVLLEMARHIPTKVTALRGMRGLHGSEIDRNGEVLIQVIEQGLRVPASEWPEAPKSKRSEPEAAGQVDLLQAVLKAIALKEEIAPALLAGASDLQELVDAKHQRDKLDLPILHGWRRKLAGESLLEVLGGRLHVSIDPQTGALKLISHEPGTTIDG